MVNSWQIYIDLVSGNCFTKLYRTSSVNLSACLSNIVSHILCIVFRWK